MKRKGAILVLIWSLLLQSEYYLIRHEFIWQTTVRSIAVPSTGFLVMVILSPIAGWLADVYFGRYKVIKWSILIVWSSSLPLTTSSVIAEFMSAYEHAGRNIINAVLLIMVELGLMGVFSNVLQFSVDQLPDASTEDNHIVHTMDGMDSL